MSQPLTSVVIPVERLDAALAACLTRLGDVLRGSAHEVLLACPEGVRPEVERWCARRAKGLAALHVLGGEGGCPADWMRAALARARGDAIVTLAGPATEGLGAIPAMVEAIRTRGAQVVSGSRYQVPQPPGGPRHLARRLGALGLRLLAGFATTDPTNGLTACTRGFLERHDIESTRTGEVGLELRAKAFQVGDPVMELPVPAGLAAAAESVDWRRMGGYLRWTVPLVRAPLLVWSVWLLSLVLLLWMARRFAVSLPFWDEWALVPVVTGHERLSLGWLWSLHNEHRIALPRLVYVLIAMFSGGNFHGVVLFNVVLLAAVAAALVLAARRVRGRTVFADAVFPLLYLSPGHAENFLAPFQVQFVLSSSLMAVALACLAGLGRGIRGGRILVLGLVLAGLPLTGANGLVVTPVLGAWLALAVLGALGRAEVSRAGRRLAWLAALGGVGVAGLYLVRYHGNPGHPASPGPVAALGAARELVSMAPGPAGGAASALAAGIVVLLFVAVTGGLLIRWIREPETRFQGSALLFFLGACAALCVAVGVGRSGFGPGAGLAMRYGLLAAPLAAALYLGATGPRGAHVTLVELVLVLVMAASFSYNLEAGVALGEERYTKIQAAERDIRAGLTPREVANRHWQSLFPDGDIVAERLDMLRSVNYGPYRDLDVQVPAPAPRPAP